MTDNLISRRDAIDELTKFFCDNDVIRGDFQNCERNERKATVLMGNVRSIDAEPVRHAKWIPCAKSGLILTEQMRKEGIRWYGFKCSACNFVRKGNAPREANYCECCGARMDAE